MRCLAREPSDRFPGMHPLLLALSSELDERASLWPGEVRIERRRALRPVPVTKERGDEAPERRVEAVVRDDGPPDGRVRAAEPRGDAATDVRRPAASAIAPGLGAARSGVAGVGERDRGGTRCPCPAAWRTRRRTQQTRRPRDPAETTKRPRLPVARVGGGPPSSVQVLRARASRQGPDERWEEHGEGGLLVPAPQRMAPTGRVDGATYAALSRRRRCALQQHRLAAHDVEGPLRHPPEDVHDRAELRASATNRSARS